eukprot:SAG22_NODE_589_length_8828_cov_4.479895_2_plen_555_part_00
MLPKTVELLLKKYSVAVPTPRLPPSSASRQAAAAAAGTQSSAGGRTPAALELPTPRQMFPRNMRVAADPETVKSALPLSGGSLHRQRLSESGGGGGGGRRRRRRSVDRNSGSGGSSFCKAAPLSRKRAAPSRGATAAGNEAEDADPAKLLLKKRRKEQRGPTSGNNSHCSHSTKHSSRAAKQPVDETTRVAAAAHQRPRNIGPAAAKADKAVASGDGKMPHGWERKVSKQTGKVYYTHARSGTTQWVHPNAPSTGKVGGGKGGGSGDSGGGGGGGTPRESKRQRQTDEIKPQALNKFTLRIQHTLRMARMAKPATAQHQKPIPAMAAAAAPATLPVPVPLPQQSNRRLQRRTTVDNSSSATNSNHSCTDSAAASAAAGNAHRGGGESGASTAKPTSAFSWPPSAVSGSGSGSGGGGGGGGRRRGAAMIPESPSAVGASSSPAACVRATPPFARLKRPAPAESLILEPACQLLPNPSLAFNKGFPGSTGPPSPAGLIVAESPIRVAESPVAMAESPLPLPLLPPATGRLQPPSVSAAGLSAGERCQGAESQRLCF